MRLLFIILTLCLKIAYTQTTNSYLFIEPNVSLNYDSNVIKIENNFSNSIYNSESYELTYIPTNARVRIDANKSFETPTQKHQDSLIDLTLEISNKMIGDTLKIYLKMYKEGIPIHYKGFSGFGVITLVETENIYTISFYCTKFYEGGLCNILYSSSNTKPIENYDIDYTVLTSLIDGITTYTNKDFELLNSLLAAKYTITVDSIVRPSDFSQYIKRTFFGRVNIYPPVEDPIKEIWIIENNGSQIFKPNTNGEIYIECNDASKGIIEKRCVLNLSNKINTQVKE